MKEQGKIDHHQFQILTRFLYFCTPFENLGSNPASQLSWLERRIHIRHRAEMGSIKEKNIIRRVSSVG